MRLTLVSHPDGVVLTTTKVLYADKPLKVRNVSLFYQGNGETSASQMRESEAVEKNSALSSQAMLTQVILHQQQQRIDPLLL